MEKIYDAIVIGLGAMGSATVCQLAKKGAKVLGIDQFDPPHKHGSTHGDSRITREAVGEGPEYVPLVQRSNVLWGAIEKESKTSLISRVGGLVIGTSAGKCRAVPRSFLANTIKIAKRYFVVHDVLSAADIRRRFPQFNIADDALGYFEYDAGFLRPEACVSAQLFLAKKYGAEIRVKERLLGFESRRGEILVKTSGGGYAARQLVLTMGAWLPEFIDPAYARLFTVYRQVMYWFDAGPAIEKFLPRLFPVFIWEMPDKPSMYGFPAINGKFGGVKVASEQYETATTPSVADPFVTEEERQAMYDTYVAPHFPDLKRDCIKAAACLYTATPDEGFVIDRHPEDRNIILVSPCSGHGFKHSPAIGEAVAEMVMEGKSRIDLSAFSLRRFAS